MKRSVAAIRRIHQCQRTRMDAGLLSKRCSGPSAPHRTRGIASLPEVLATIAPATQRRHRHAHQATLHGVHPQQLYWVINDVDRYREFLPYCRESRVLRAAGCGTLYDAVLGVGLPGLLEERYVSRVRALPPPAGSGGARVPTWTVEAKSIRSGLFDSLKSRWKLTHAYRNSRSQDTQHISGNGAGDGTEQASCSVDFEVELLVSNPIVSLSLDRVLRDVATKQVEAFERRCREQPVTH